jgi:hypothetical protein
MHQSNIFDPCDDYDCKAEMVPVHGGYCEIFEKGPFDYDCFVPCIVENCTVRVIPAHQCIEYFCTPHPSSTTTTLTPSPTEPTPSLPPEAVVGISCAGKILD